MWQMLELCWKRREAPPRAQLAKFTCNAKIWIEDKGKKGRKRRARARGRKSMDPRKATTL